MQAQHENRILFLKLFTQELVENTKPKIFIKEEIEFMHPIQGNLPMPAFKPIPTQIQPQLSSSQAMQLIKPITMPVEQLQPRITPKPRIQPQLIPTSTQPQPIQVQPDLSKSIPAGFSIGKIDSLLQDPTINMIECPGPEKLVLVRALGKIKTTKLSLNEQEIKQIIESFSQQSRIPIMTGIFKAAVGNLLITAIISEFVGSRFIITKRIQPQITQ